MDIEQLQTHYGLMPDVKEAVKRVEEMTGKSIEFRIVAELGSFALLKAARDRMTSHIIYIREGKTPYINHLILHEVHHIYRFWSVVDGERRVMIGGDSPIEGWKKELGKKASAYPEQIFVDWEEGINRLLYNAITDSRIERAIYRDYPDMRAEQIRSLKNIEEEAKMSVSKQIERIVPPSLFVATNAMNYAFLALLTPIIGRSWKKAFKGQKEIIDLGQSLVKMVPDEDGGLSEDIRLIDAWCARIGLPKVRWGDFQAVPIGYEDMI